MNLLLNDIVLINENEMLPRNHWHREVIHVLLVGRDNQVRGAVLRVLSNGKVIHIKWDGTCLTLFQVWIDNEANDDEPVRRNAASNTDTFRQASI